MWISSFPSTVCWIDYLCSIVSPLFLCRRSVDWSRFIFLHVAVQFFQRHLLKRISIGYSFLLRQRLVGYIFVGPFLHSLLCSIYLSVCFFSQHYWYLEQIITCCGGCPMHCRTFSSIPGFYHSMPVTPPFPVVMTKNVPRHYQTFFRDKLSHVWEPLA